MKGVLRILFFTGLLLTVSTYAIELPLTVVSSPTYPVSVNTSATTSDLTYTFKNNVNDPHNPGLVITPQLTSYTASSGTMAVDTGSPGTCVNGVTYNNTCTINLKYTAPSSTPSPNPVTVSIIFGYDGRNNLPAQTGTFTIVSGTTLAVTEPSLMFVNRDFGNAGTGYKGSLTVRNTGSITATNILATPSASSGITYVSDSPTNCLTSLPAGNSCVLTFSSNIPLTNPTTSTISITASNVSTPVSVSVASISVVALAPPLNNLPSSTTGNYRNFEGLTLVAGCPTYSGSPNYATTDSGLLQITNNSSTTVSNITATASSGLSGVTITSPTYVANTNNYCNGQSLATNDSCEIQANAGTASAGSTGTVTFSGTGTQSVGVATTVESVAGTFPYSTGNNAAGNYTFVANNTCNLVEQLSRQSDTTNNVTWSQAATYCNGSPGAESTAYQDWRFPDVGPLSGNTNGTSAGWISGEFYVLNGGASEVPVAVAFGHYYWGPSINSDVQTSSAWFEDPLGGIASQYAFLKSYEFGLLYVRCARAFTQ